MTDTAPVVQQRAGDELCRSRGDLLRQPGELALRPGTHIELPPAGLYLIGGCGQSAGIVARLTIHTTQDEHPGHGDDHGARPFGADPRVWLTNYDRVRALALPIRSPTGQEQRISPGRSVVQQRPPEP